MTEEEPTGRDRRRFARVALDAQVSVSVADSDRLFESKIRDLSENGVFICTEATRPIGTGVQLKIRVESQNVEFVATGIIVHEVINPDDGPDVGVGVMFTDIQGFDALLKLVAMGEIL